MFTKLRKMVIITYYNFKYINEYMVLKLNLFYENLFLTKTCMFLN